MLNVKSGSEAEQILKERFTKTTGSETVGLAQAVGRVVFSDIRGDEFVPDFNRSTVDGYAVRASDTFGCSEAIPALLKLIGSVEMGKAAELKIADHETAYVPTGAQLPEDADAMVMLEYAEDFGGGTIALQKSAAPGAHIIFRGDDVKSGDRVFERGHRLLPKDTGALAAMGIGRIEVFKKPRVAIISTGDELVPFETKQLKMGQIRDVNAPLLAAAISSTGCECTVCEIVRDDPLLLKKALERALSDSDMVLLSGGSSVGKRDASAQVMGSMGEILFHGLALKPGKPTIAADIGGKPVFGLPGHPVATFFVYNLFVRPVLSAMMGSTPRDVSKRSVCAAAIPSNHGREECVPVYISGGKAHPIMSKSGLITTLSGADGFIRIPRDAEGIDAGDEVEVFLFSEVI